MSSPTPNVLLILTDQQRWDSIGSYGADWIDTPNLDRLAREGVRFDRCYCTNPICTPSRASLWTGKHLPGHGVYRLDDILPESEVLFSEHLRHAGYRTGLFGKLHVSGRAYEDVRRHPNDGFDEYQWALEGPLHMDAPMQAYARWLKERDPAVHAEMKRLGRDLLHVPRELHFTHWAAEGAAGFIKANAGTRPFFCCMSVFDPHNPYRNYPIEYADRVDRSRMPRPIGRTEQTEPMHVCREREHSYLGNIDEMSDRDIEEMRLGYYASIALIDDEIGGVLETLDKSGASDNTLVVFASDHGDMLGDHGLLVKGAMAFDPCIRVPLIIRWPEGGPAGRTVDAPVQLCDIAPTVLESCGVASPVAELPASITGRNLTALAEGSESSVRNETVCLYRNTGINRTTRDWDPPLHVSTILDGHHKLSIHHGNHEGRPAGELYDLDVDPEELNSLWDDPGATEVRLDLQERLIDWLATNEITWLGSRGGTAVVPPEQYVANTIDRNR